MASALPEQLHPLARSAYRSVLRASRITFHGDPPRQVALNTALRQTFSSPTLTAPPPPSSQSSSSSSTPRATPEPAAGSVSEAELRKRLEEWQEVAKFLRRNVVQGEKIEGDEGRYRLRVTRDTELGDNATVKAPPKLPTTPFPNRNRRRKCSDAQETA